MSQAVVVDNEINASDAFSRQSVVFDEIYATNTIINYKRARVREHITQYLKPGSKILELNSGTGEDAIYFARQGHHVHATDVSTGMQRVLKQKSEDYQNHISMESCSYTRLDQLKQQGPYDHIFSNFGGLNCTGELEKVLLSFDKLLKPCGKVTMVIIPPFCFWETLLIFKCKFKTATRRFFANKGRTAHIEGTYFKCFYYTPFFVTNTLRKSFNALKVEGLCTIVPPSYMEGFAEKYPQFYNYLRTKENKFKSSWPWKYMGDYFIISLQKK